METPSESDTPPPEARPVTVLSTIPSSGTEEVKGLRGLIQLQHQHAALNVNGQYTPPASQSTPPSAQYPRNPPEEVYQREPSPYLRETTPPIIHRDPSPRVVTPQSLHGSIGRRVSSESSSSSSISSHSKSLGRSSLRHLLASTSPQAMDIALEGVQKGLEALNVRKLDDYRPRVFYPLILLM